MRAEKLSSVERKAFLGKNQEYFVGLLPSGKTMGFIAESGQSILLETPYAIFPTEGLRKNSPLFIVAGERSWPQPHPQNDSPFTRYFVKGMLYSGLGNILPFMIFNPHILVFWFSTFFFAGLYYFSSRPLPGKVKFDD